MNDDEYITEENAQALREELKRMIGGFAPDCNILDRERLLEIGFYQYIWHMAEGFPQSTSLMWARNHMINSGIAGDE